MIREHSPETKPLTEHFPQRNRIPGDISLGVLVGEADIRSDELITAGISLEQNREVLAVLGSILSPGNCGTSRIIQEGAELVRDCGDVLEELNLGSVVQQLELTEIVPESDIEPPSSRNCSSNRSISAESVATAACRWRWLAVHWR